MPAQGSLLLAVAGLLVAAGPSSELLRVDAEWDAALAARDEAGFLSRVAQDAVFSGGTLQVGRVAIRERWAPFFAAGGPTLRWSPTHSGLAPSGDLGFTTGDASHSWKEKDVAPTPGRYITVWARDASGRWMAVLDAPLEPPSDLPSTRSPVRTVNSRDGTLEATIGTFTREAGPGPRAGTFLVVRERQGGAMRTVVETEVPAPPPR